MNLSGICITTDNAPRLAEFYQAVFQTEPMVDGKHYRFCNFAIWDPDGNKIAVIEEQCNASSFCISCR